MSHFEYEKPSAVEISERELDEIAAVLSSGSVPLTKFDEEIRKGAGYPANTIGDNLGLLSSLICNQFSNKSYQYQVWLFFRVIGGFSYKDKVLGEMTWEAFAGPLSYDYEQTPGGAVPAQEQQFFVETLGMPKKNYRYLRFFVRLQHYMCGADGFDSYKEKYKTIVDNSLSSFQKTLGEFGDCLMPGKTDEIVTASNYKEFLNTCHSEMYGKCDLAHMCITTASLLAQEAGYPLTTTNTAVCTLYPGLSERITSDEARKAFTGWLGDVCFIEPSDGKTTMGNDDFFSDVDAIKIADICLSNGWNYRRAIKDCYSSSYSRRDYFLKSYMDLSEVVTCMRLGSNNNSSLTNDQWLNSISTDKVYEDTYRFYRILKGEVSEPVL